MGMRAVAWLVSLGLIATSAEVITFDSGPIGKVPPGWIVTMTHKGGPPHWEIRKDPTARTQPYVFAQVSADPTDNRFPLAILDRVSLRDADVSVRLKPVGGKEDQAGGLVWRYRDENNYYLVRANALEKNVMVFKVVNGERIALTPRGLPPRSPGVAHDIASNAWLILKVSARGSHFAIFVNHRRILQVDDATFDAAGKVGLWTKSDSVTYFDDFRVYPR
jgi:hypothetical protein